LLLSRIELTEGKLSEAVARAESALVFEPNNPIALYQAALLSLENGSTDAARTYLERAVSANPDYSDARFYLGSILLDVGDLPRALEQFEQVLLRNPDNALIRDAVEKLRRGENPAIPDTLEGDVDTEVPAS
jgi:tetratricopeptide (TPR) repeat protein